MLNKDSVSKMFLEMKEYLKKSENFDDQVALGLINY